MINQDNMFILTREELKQTGASNFKHGDCVICGNYLIHIKYHNYDNSKTFHYPSLLTTVNTRNDIRDIIMSKQPQYIRDFIEDYNIERVS
jgi:hypothetical protein